MAEVTSTIAPPNPRQIHLPRARLACEAGAEHGQSWQVDRDVIQIGALQSGDVVLTDPTVSRRHAEIVRTSSGSRTSLTVVLVTMPSVPSEPTTAPVRS